MQQNIPEQISLIQDGTTSRDMRAVHDWNDRGTTATWRTQLLSSPLLLAPARHLKRMWIHLQSFVAARRLTKSSNLSLPFLIQRMSTSVPTDLDSTAGSTPAGGAPAVAQPLHSASEAASQTAATSSPSTPLLMQIVVRKDLLEVSLIPFCENYALRQ